MADNKNNNSPEVMRIGDNTPNNAPKLNLDDLNEGLDLTREQLGETTSLIQSQKEALGTLIKTIKQLNTDLKTLDDSVKNSRKQSQDFYQKDKTWYTKKDSEDKLNRIKEKRDKDFFRRDVEKIEKDRAKIAFGDVIKKAGELPDKAARAMLPYARAPIKLFDLFPTVIGKVLGTLANGVASLFGGGRRTTTTSRSGEPGYDSTGRMRTSESGLTNPFSNVGKVFENMGEEVARLDDDFVNGSATSSYSLFQLGEFLSSPSTTPLGGFLRNLFAGMGGGEESVGAKKPKSDLVWMALIAGITIAILALAPGLNYLIVTLAPVIAKALMLVVTIWTDLWNAFKPVLPIITELLKSLFTAILEIWNATKEGVVKALVTVINLITTVVTTIAQGIINFINSPTFKKIEKIVGQIVDKIVDLIGWVINSPQEVGKFITKIKDWLFALPGKLTAVMGSIGDTIANGWKDMFPGAGKTISNVTENVKTGVNNAWNGVVSFGKSVWDGFENLGIFKVINSVLGFIQKGVENLFASFDDLGFFLRKLGFRISLGPVDMFKSDEEINRRMIIDAQAKAKSKESENITRDALKAIEGGGSGITTKKSGGDTINNDNRTISYADLQPFALSPFINM